MELIEYRRRIISNGPHINKSEGDISTFNTDIVKPLKACKVNFNPVQSGTGDPSPNNIRPIIGLTGLKMFHTGKNLMHGLEIGESYNNNTGEPNTMSTAARSAKVRVNFSKYEYYTLTLDTNDFPYIMIFAWDEDGNFVGRSGGSGDNPYRVKKNSFTLGNNGNRNYDHIKYIAVRWYDRDTRVVANLESAHIQLEAGYNATPYEPSVMNGIVVSFSTQGDNTIYGGTLDILTGLLLVTHWTRDLGSLTWDVQTGSNNTKYFRSEAITDIKKISSTGVVADILCPIFKTVAAATIYSGSAANDSIGQEDSTNTRIRIKATEYNDDATALKTALNGVILCYELRIPVTVQLTPTEVKTLLGVNNIWADAGNTSVEYWTY